MPKPKKTVTVKISGVKNSKINIAGGDLGGEHPTLILDGVENITIDTPKINQILELAKDYASYKGPEIKKIIAEEVAELCNCSVEDAKKLLEQNAPKK